MHYYSLLVDAISLFFVLYTYVQVERGKFARGEGGAWALVWVLVGVFATYPSLFSSITSALGVTLPINLIYGVFTLFLLFMLYRLEQRVDELQRVVLLAVQKKVIEEASSASSSAERDPDEVKG